MLCRRIVAETTSGPRATSLHTVADSPPPRSRWLWSAAALPALIVTAPLLGFSLQGDERQRAYEAARLYGSNPLEAARGVYGDIGVFLDHGNFRPIGRFTEAIERSFTVEAAEATGLTLSAVQGVLRALAVAVLAVVAMRVAAALAPPSASSATARLHPATALFPLIFAAALVAAGPAGSLTKYSFRIIGWVILILLLALAVARHRDLRARPVSWRELALMAALGLAAPLTYDLVYVAPPLVAVFMLARNAAIGHPLKNVLRTAALRRWAAFSAGFLAAFVPVRLIIADRCSQNDCYAASEIDVSGEMVQMAAERALSGAPPAGWHPRVGTGALRRPSHAAVAARTARRGSGHRPRRGGDLRSVGLRGQFDDRGAAGGDNPCDGPEREDGRTAGRYGAGVQRLFEACCKPRRVRGRDGPAGSAAREPVRLASLVGAADRAGMARVGAGPDRLVVHDRGGRRRGRRVSLPRPPVGRSGRGSFLGAVR